jgi:hypothetical protein
MTSDTSGGGELSDKVLDFERIVKETVTKAKEPGFSPEDWAPLAELVAVGEFERVGCWLEVMNWTEYTEFLTKWASQTAFETKRRRISELPGPRLLGTAGDEHHRSAVHRGQLALGLRVQRRPQDPASRHLPAARALGVAAAPPARCLRGSIEPSRTPPGCGTAQPATARPPSPTSAA